MHNISQLWYATIVFEPTILLETITKMYRSYKNYKVNALFKMIIVTTILLNLDLRNSESWVINYHIIDSSGILIFHFVFVSSCTDVVLNICKQILIDWQVIMVVYTDSNEFLWIIIIVTIKCILLPYKSLLYLCNSGVNSRTRKKTTFKLCLYYYSYITLITLFLKLWVYKAYYLPPLNINYRIADIIKIAAQIL